MQRAIAITLLAAGIGIPAAFFTIALPAMMRDGGASLMQIGLIYLVWLPSVFKWLWAPWLARHILTPRARQLAALWLALALAFSFLPVAWLAESMAIGWLLALTLISASLGLSLHLVIADWCLSCLAEEERARVNGYTAAGMVAGGVLGGGLSPWLAGQLGWLATTLALSLMIALTGLAGRCLTPGASAQPTEPPEMPRLSHAIRLFSGTDGRLLLFGVGLIAATGAVDLTLSARLIDAGFSFEQAALILGTVATLLMVPASLGAGAVVAQFGAGRVFLSLCLGKGAVLMAIALVSDFSANLIGALAVAEFVLASALTVVTWQLYMSLKGHAGTLGGFALMGSCDALMRLILGFAAGALGVWSGYGALFALVAGVNVLAGLWIQRNWPDAARQGAEALPGEA